MAEENETTDKQTHQIVNFLEIAIRIGVLGGLVYWSFEIIRPFLLPVAWGIIIAIALYPSYLWLKRQTGDRGAIAAVILVILALVIVLGPTLLLSGTLIDSVRTIAADLREGTVTIPPLPESIARWPLVGERLDAFWSLMSQNLQEALGQIKPEIRAVGKWLLSAAASTGIAILHLTAAIIIAGFIVYYGKYLGELSYKLFRRLAGPRGTTLAVNAEVTVRSVARGVLGIALLQAILAGLGFLVVGLPAPGVLAVICLILATVQIGLFPVLVPTVIYIYSTSDPVTGTVFLAWCVFITLIDNVLKPMLLGRGGNVPMLVIFTGAIGGLISTGIIGLFIGSVVLSLAYQLFMTWLDQKISE